MDRVSVARSNARSTGEALLARLGMSFMTSPGPATLSFVAGAYLVPPHAAVAASGNILIVEHDGFPESIARTIPSRSRGERVAVDSQAHENK